MTKVALLVLLAIGPVFAPPASLHAAQNPSQRATQQPAPPPSESSTQASAQPPGQQPSRQTPQQPIIADVHPSATSHLYAANSGGVISEGRYAMRDAGMLKLIREAYGVNQDDIAGGPGWLSHDIFDVVFKVPEGTTPESVRPMLQSVLTDRFGLVVHRDTRPMPRWTITVGKQGSKLRPPEGTGEPGCKTVHTPSGWPPPPGETVNFKIACRNVTPAVLADTVNQMAGDYLSPNITSSHHIIDSTRLKGSWDFDLEWTPRGYPDPNHITIFEAVSNQLGLKLEQQSVPSTVLVVDRVNRKPTDNPPAVATMLAIPPPRFEVAAVKPQEPGKTFTGFGFTGGSQVTAAGTLRFLIGLAYQIPYRAEGDMVVGLPKSAEAQHWNILAKLPSTGEGSPNYGSSRPTLPAFSDLTEMLRGVLLDQFELKAHTENREVTVWALTVYKDAPKMKRADDSERTGCNADFTAPTPPGSNIGHMVKCTNESMAQFAENLERMNASNLDHPIIDATGLTGGWDFLLGWTPTSQLQNAAPHNPDQPAGSASDPTGRLDVPIFEALERQVGLKLVLEKRSIPVIVVDHVDETPVQ